MPSKGEKMLQRKTQSSNMQNFKEVLGDFKMSTAC